MAADMQGIGEFHAHEQAGSAPAKEELNVAEMTARAAQAAALLKALSHEGRLMILCHLSSGERSVTELEHLLEQRQAAVSQQLARLRGEGLVTARREGKAIYYSLKDPRSVRIMNLLYEMYCKAV